LRQKHSSEVFIGEAGLEVLACHEVLHFASQKSKEGVSGVHLLSFGGEGL